MGVLGGLFDRLLAWADVLRNGTAWASLLLPLAGLVVVWMYRRGGIKTAGGTDLIIQAARGEQPVSRLLAPVVFCATVLTHAFGGSAGREGAALQMGGSLAELVRKGTGLGGEFQDLAIMCGMSAGFSAVFGSPITATLFALDFFASHKPKSIPRVLFLKDRIICKRFFIFLYEVIFRSNLPRMQLRHS